MRRIPITFFLLLAVFVVNSQVIVDHTDMPVPGDTINFRQTTILNGINYQQTDTAFTWDFSALSPSVNTTDTFVTVSSTNLAYMIVFNNILYPEYKATVAQAQEMMTIPFVPVTISESYNFYKNSNSCFSLLGLGAKINGIPTPLKYNNPDVWYTFPVTYGSSDTSDSEFHVSIPNIGYYGQTRHRINYVDGWGTLYLPSDTFDVIRVKSKVTYFDTIYSDSVGYGIGINRNITEYKWLTDGFHEPVLQITKQGPGATAKFHYHEPDDLSVQPDEVAGHFEIYPNPASDLIFIKSENIEKNSILTITDISGREMLREEYRTGSPISAISVEQLQKGMYFISFTDAACRYSAKFIKE
ncbi:MAG TPA: T9SS type A sorting domain-containing protein [Bacteroidales bacterium]|nr:T9SS type A sorting domain-containing protein [Bacteroidales bacterium]